MNINEQLELAKQILLNDNAVDTLITLENNLDDKDLTTKLVNDLYESAEDDLDFKVIDKLHNTLNN